jgi:hypothetical protein
VSRTYLIVAVAVALVAWLAVWAARNSAWEEVSVPQPLRGEARANPFYAAGRFVGALGATAELRHAIGELPHGRGVLVLAHWNWSIVESRRAAIERWVEGGGRLVLDRNLVVSDASLYHWSGLTNVRVAPGGGPTDDGPADLHDETSSACGPLEVHHDAQGISGNRTDYSICTGAILRAFLSDREPQWSLADAEGLQAVRVAVGAGSVTWLNAAPFGGRGLMEADHGRVFVAATQLRPGDHVIFMTEADRPSLLALIWRVGAPVVMLLLLCLGVLLWRNGVRFGPPAPATPSARRSLAEQIRGTADFTRRFGGGRSLHAAQVRALDEAAARRIPRYHSLSRQQRAQAVAGLVSVDAGALAQIIDDSGPRSRHELRKALESLEVVCRRLSADDRT